MSARIRLARTSCDLDSVFHVRHQVFAEEEGYFASSAEGRVFDRFDAFPESAIVLADVAGEVVGTFRITEDSQVGTSGDSWYDFRPHLPKGARAGCASLLAVRRKYRTIPGLTFATMAMGYFWAEQRGLTHIVGAINPDVVPMFLGKGWQALGPEAMSQAHDLPYVPMLLELRQLNDKFRAFLETQKVEHVFGGFERAFYQAGEKVFEVGDAGDAAFVVVDGEFSVHRGDGSYLSTLHPVDIFGEVALLTGGQRTATIVARTDAVVTVVDRETFEATVRRHPDAALALLRLIASRLATLA